MFYCDKETHVELSYEYPNLINENKIYLLPKIIVGQHAVVEIFLTQKQTAIVETQYESIRNGRHSGGRVHLSACYGGIDYNPKFIWNGKEWLLNTFGTFIFAEIEINQPIKKEN